MFLHGRTCTKRNLSHALVHVLIPPSSYTHAQVVTNLQQTCSNAVPTTCHQDMFAACSQLVDKLSTACWQRYKVVELHRRVTSCSNNLSSGYVRCLFPACWQVVNGLLTTLQSCWASQTCYKLFQQLLQQPVIVLHFDNLSTSCEWQPCRNLTK